MSGNRLPIRRLPPNIVDRIAAGEVIERPASVVKELVENALDAGARRVRVDVRGGGLELIRVGDDGMGIPREELPLAVERHATSKLAGADLSQVRSLGFRGEALPSIAAVAELSIISSPDESGVGRQLRLRDRQIILDEPAPQPRGTTVSVRDLFAHLPVRRQVVQGRAAEHLQISQMARRLALTAPGVRLMLTIDDRLLFQTSGSGDLARTLVEVYGLALADHLVPVGPLAVAGARLEGWLADPSLTRPGRAQLNLIINGRWVQPRGLMAQLEAAYRPLLPRGRHPLLAVMIELPSRNVDINIHPAKMTVRLHDESAIGAALAEAVRHCLGRQPRRLEGGLEPGVMPPEPTRGIDPPAHHLRETGPDWDDQRPIETANLPPLQLIGQVRDRLLLLEGPAGLYLIDQHRAHERIIYERLRRLHGHAAAEPLALPEPLVLELSVAQEARFRHRLGELAGLGFGLERFGERTFLLRSTPPLAPLAELGGSPVADPDLSPPAAQITDLLGPAALLALTDEAAGEGEEWHDRLLVRLACATAVRRGRSLNRPTMRWLVEQLGESSAPAVCPHGSPLLLHVSAALLERQFDWR